MVKRSAVFERLLIFAIVVFFSTLVVYVIDCIRTEKAHIGYIKHTLTPEERLQTELQLLEEEHNVSNI